MLRRIAPPALLALLLGAGPAPAAQPDVVVEGPYCGPAGCAGASRSALGSGAGFTAAATAALLLARRRRG